ncbi:helix-turn-helix transcriptional regulator [Arthrobacter sp. AQ5-05]|uniref:helix-turn-helix domain-containing protein n=1 Tax=Arthrobacter sp. AQ5-05 TaxID=2184581 RepID=UPI0015EBF184|nr:helix-turn-helix transcriptional regulator [Arthrobacter sp. AQ5-05]
MTERPVRALIQQGKLKAQKVGRTWQIDDLQLRRAERRPLSEHSRLVLSRALHNRSLTGLSGQDRKRTAKRIAEQQASDNPAALLIDWWGGKHSCPLNFGTNLVEHALAGHSAHVFESLHGTRHEYLRKPEDLADVASSERLIQRFTQAELADKAQVSLADLKMIERAIRLPSPTPSRRILRILSIEPTALPTLAVVGRNVEKASRAN